MLRRNMKQKQLLKVDCHSHILPGMDDGAQDVGVSLEMLRASTAYGVESILLTPHYYPTVESLRAFVQRRESATAVLKEACKTESVPRLIVGAEVRIERELSASLSSFKPLCIEGTDRILLELPYLPMGNWMIEEIEGICYTHRCKPILAHLPRYMAYFSDEEFEELLSFPDMIVQVNAEDMQFRHVRQRVLKWWERGVPLVFGSDCHNMDARRPNLDMTAKHIAKNRGGTSMAIEANEIAKKLGWL